MPRLNYDLLNGTRRQENLSNNAIKYLCNYEYTIKDTCKSSLTFSSSPCNAIVLPKKFTF